MADATGTGAGVVQRITGAGTGNALLPSGAGAGNVQRVNGAGTGNIAITGTGAPTVQRIRSNAQGVVAISGTMAATVQRVVGAGAGGMVPSGTGAATVQRITGASAGLIAVTGTMAAQIVRIIGKSGITYEVKVKSKPLPAGLKLSDFGELFDMKAYCEFYDNWPFAITLIRDYERGDADFDYATYREIINQQASSLQPNFRQHIAVVPGEGFFANHFQYYVEKTIPVDGRFKWFGADFEVIPRPEVDSEFLATETP